MYKILQCDCSEVPFRMVPFSFQCVIKRNMAGFSLILIFAALGNESCYELNVITKQAVIFQFVSMSPCAPN